MRQSDKKNFLWHVAGFFWIVFTGIALHFLYEWTGKCALAGIISPVNESVWEHLKMGYWTLFFFSCLEYPFTKKEVKSYFTGKAIGIVTFGLLIVSVFYLYTSFTKKEILWIDISLYVIGVFLCQFINGKLSQKQFGKSIEIAGIVIFCIIGIIMGIFTFYPPHLPVFRDVITGAYGIQGK